MVLEPLYFATSGIRGKANTEIGPDLVLRIGKAVAAWIIQNKRSESVAILYIGYDNRRNSKNLAYILAGAANSLGVDVKITNKPIPTPLIIHATINSDANAGIMITGSHLPAMDNGLILFDDKGNYFKGILEDSNVDPVSWADLGITVEFVNEISEYTNFLSNIADDIGVKPMDINIIIDPAHGVMKDYLYNILNPLVNHIHKVNWEEDDTFPGRISEPSPENLVKTKEILLQNNSDLAITTDMDGDRVMFITKSGKVISGDYIGAMLAKWLWSKNSDETTIVPINTSAILPIIAENMGGNYIFCKVGPPSIIEAIYKNKANFGFEESGKYIFTQHAIWPDAVITSLMIFLQIQESGKSLEELIDEIPVLYSNKTKIPMSRSISSNLMTAIKQNIYQDFNNVTSLNDMDGLRITFDDNSWLLIRPSGTEDYIRIFSEHSDKQISLDLNEKGQKLINKYS